MDIRDSARNISTATAESCGDAFPMHTSHGDADIKVESEATGSDPSSDTSQPIELSSDTATEPFVEELFGAPPVIFTRTPLLDAELFASYVDYLYKDSTHMRRPPLRIKAAIRNLEREHRDELRELRNKAKTLELEESIVEIRRKEQILEQWRGKEGRLEGSLAKSTGNAKSISAISEKILALKEESGVIEAEVIALRQSNDAYTKLQGILDELDALEEHIGLASLRRELKESQSSQGRSLVSSGSSFEDVGAAYVRQTMLYRVAHDMEIPLRCLRYTSNLTLHIPAMSHAAGEFDGVVFEVDEADAGETGPQHVIHVKRVLYIVEIKRYINDIGPALPSRLRTLHWLAGLTPDNEAHEWTNRFYPKGKYNCPVNAACHEHTDPNSRCRYLFAPAAFEHFASLYHANRESEFVHFFVKRADITCMDSEDTNRVADWLCTHADYNEDLDARDEKNAKIVEFIRSKCLTLSKNAPDTLNAFDVISKYPGIVHYLA